MRWNIEAECISTVILCIIWVYSRRSNSLPTLKNKLFQVCFLTTFCAMASNIASTLMIYEYQTVPLILNWLVALVYFAATPLMGVAYFLYAVSIIYENQPRIPKSLVILTSIPAACYLAVVLSNPFTKALFDINLTDGYVKGPLIMSTYIVFYCYCLACFVLILCKSSLVDLSIRRILTAFPLIATLVVLIQQFFPNMILSGSAATCALLLLYLYLQNKQISIDHLLGIPNRQEFLETLQLHLKKRNNAPFSIATLSLRDFKQVNDQFGQQTGDEFLKAVGSYISVAAAPHRVYRFSGDEFAVLIFSREQQLVNQLALRLQDRMKDFWEVRDYRCLMSAAIGVVQYPDCADNMKDIINAIEYSVTEAKKEKHSNICYCSPEMLDKSRRQQRMIQIIKDKIEQDGFDVYFQPIWAIREQKFTLAEALLRLDNSPLGPLYPSELIPLAEDTGLIVPITYQVLDKACRFVKRMHALGTDLRRVTVNFSAVQFSQQNLAQKVIAIIEHHGIPYDSIKIEITESVLAENYQVMYDFMEAMHEKGIQVGLDDFGTGYCNLISVMCMPLDMVKLDKSLLWSSMTNEKSAIMMRNISRSVQELGMKVVSEGVETKEQEAFVKQCGCDFIQGYLYARPMTAGKAEELLLSKMGEKTDSAISPVV